jgi:rubrerythrin
MKIYFFELSNKTTNGIESDSIYTIDEHTAIEYDFYYKVFANDKDEDDYFFIPKDEINKLENCFMWSLENNPKIFIEQCMEHTKETIQYYKSYLNTLTNKLSILEKHKGE